MPTDSCDPSSSANVTDISEVPEKKSLAKKALQKLSWKGKGKQPSWPEPEKSIGDFKSKIGSQSYWTVRARSPARDAYKEIAPKVKKYLEDYMGDDTLKLFLLVVIHGGRIERYCFTDYRILLRAFTISKKTQ